MKVQRQFWAKTIPTSEQEILANIIAKYDLGCTKLMSAYGYQLT
jgi:hypothetical protein